MKLHAKDAAAFDDSGEFSAVFAGGGCFFSVGGRREGMSEVEIVVWRYAFEQGTGPKRANLIPSHVREFDVLGKMANIAIENAEAGEVGGFGTFCVECLQPETNAEKGCTARKCVVQWGPKGMGI